MKDKYEFLLSLKSLAYAIQELNAFSKKHADCYDLLKDKLDELCHFMVNEDSKQKWNLWANDEEIRLHSDQLREIAVQALCDIEKHQSVCTCNNQLNISDYIDVLSGSVKEELKLFGIDSTSKVLFIGSGAFPLSALTIAKETGADVMCLDIDAEAVHLGREIAEVSGLESQVQFSGNSARELEFLKEATHVVIASLVQNKLEVIDDLKDSVNENVKIILRYGNGLKSIFNYPLENDLSAEWDQIRITRHHSIYDTLILEPRKNLVKGR